MLDRGQTQDWFNSTEICLEAASAAFFGYLFVAHTFTARKPAIRTPPISAPSSNAEARAIAGHQLPQIDANARVEQEQVNLSAYGFSGAPGLASGNPEFHLYSVGGGITYDLDLFGRPASSDRAGHRAGRGAAAAGAGGAPRGRRARRQPGADDRGDPPTDCGR